LLLAAGGAANSATTTVSYQVSAGTDDGFAQSAAVQDITSAYLKIGDEHTYAVPYQISGMRFVNVNIPRSATIISAYLKISSINTDYRGQIYGVIAAESSDNPTDFSGRLIGDAALTTASVVWDRKTAWSPDTQYTSPDISNVVQEVVNHPGFSSGNSMAIYYSTRELSGKGRSFGSYEYSPSSAAVLEITYETYTISGYILTTESTPLEGVAVSAGADIEGDVTDASGYYELKVPSGWIGTVTPSKTDWGFIPVNQPYSNVSSDQLNQDYTAFQPVISGYVRDGSGAGVDGVSVSSDNGGGSDTTDATGYYEIIVPYDWTGIVTVSKTGWNFTPSSRSYSNVTSDQTNEDYTAFQPKISGYIRDSNGIGVNGVLISADNGGGLDTTDATGFYEIIVSYNWSGMVTPNKPEWGFNPTSQIYSNVTTNQMNQDYTVFQPKISGYFTDSNGLALEQVMVSADNGASDISNSDGYYEITVPYMWSGTVRPILLQVLINPPERYYANIIEEQVSQDYTVVEFGPVSLTSTLQVSSGPDDGYERNQFSYSYSSDSLFIGYQATAYTSYYALSGMRFSNVDLPRLAFIREAKLDIHVHLSDSDPIYGILHAEDEDDTISFSSTNKIHSRVRTSASVTWNHSDPWLSENWYTSPDISSLVQEVISRQGWSAGNALAIIYSNTWRPDLGYNLLRTFSSYEYGESFAPKLEVTYEVPRFISGYVRDPNGMGMEEASIEVSSGASSTITDVNGYYEIIVPYGWSGTVACSLNGWIFEPVNTMYSNVTIDLSGQDFNLPLITVSGYITTLSGEGLSNVIVSTDDGEGSDLSDSVGYFEFMVPRHESIIIKPRKAGWDFEPQSLSFDHNLDDLVNVNFSAVIRSVKPVIYQVSASSDDVIAGFTPENSNYGQGSDTPDLRIGLGTYPGNKVAQYSSSMRFVDVNIPYGAKITNARLKILSYGNYSEPDVYAWIYAQDTDDAPPFSGRIIDLERTTTKVSWNHLVDWSLGTMYTSPDITDVIKEVIDRPGWLFGNSLAILYICDPNYNSCDGCLVRKFSAYDHDSTKAPMLDITIAYHIISGYIRRPDGNGVPGVTVTAENIDDLVVTNGDGYYELYVPDLIDTWSGSVSVNKTGWYFEPSMRSYGAVTGNLSDQNYTGFGVKISGYVTNKTGTSIEGVEIAVDDNEFVDITDIDGFYEVAVNPGWSGMITPSKEERNWR
jgi:hypothetical protein